MRELLLLRHGTTECNERRAFTGQLDIGLSARGREQIIAMRDAMPKAERFFTSGMLRANQTLSLMYGEVAHTEIRDLAEYNFGDFQGKTHDELFESEPIYRQWLDRDAVDVICPGGESRLMFDERVRRGFEALVGQCGEGLSVMICHGGVIRGVLRMFVLSGEWTNTPTANGCGWRLFFSEQGQVVRHEAFP